jgi:hypothetical protein
MRVRTISKARIAIALGLLLGLTAGAGRAFAEEVPPPPPPVPKSWFQQITINAYASTSYTWNFNDPLSRINTYRVFDQQHNSFSIDAAEVVLQKAVANKGDFGFRIDVAMGSVARVASAAGLMRDPDSGKGLDIDLQQAFASYIIPVGHGLRLDFGKFVTPVGYELIDGYDGYNDNFSRSFLFGFAIPFTHTGLKLTYPFSDKFAASVSLVNGWDNVVDNNAAKSFFVNFAITPISPLAIYLTYIGGPERSDSNSDFRNLIDLVVTAQVHPKLKLAFNGDYAYEVGGRLGPDPAFIPTGTGDVAPLISLGSAQWAAFALYIRAQINARFALIARGEIFLDLDSVRFGAPYKSQRLIEGTLTAEVRLTDAIIVRPEFRIDGSDRKVFEDKSGAPSKNYQPTLAINALYVF